MENYKIRWVIAHDPLSLFWRAAENFSKTVNARSKNGQIEIEIMTTTQYADRYNDGKPVDKHDLLDLMELGKIEMSQMYTTWLAEKFSSDMHVLDLPFLFRDHDHARRVLEGNIGEQLLNSLNEKSNVQGLAFTYSGGFRMIPATIPIRRVEDFKGLRLRSNKNPFAVETFRMVGAIPVPCELEEINEGVMNGEFIGGESAWPRVYPLEQNTFSKAMNDTRHSLFLTSMIVRKSFWNQLPKEIQTLMKECAVHAAREERAESIRDGENAQALARAEGIEIVLFSESESEKFQKMTEPVYEKFSDFFSPGLVDSIKKQ